MRAPVPQATAVPSVAVSVPVGEVVAPVESVIVKRVVKRASLGAPGEVNL